MACNSTHSGYLSMDTEDMELQTAIHNSIRHPDAMQIALSKPKSYDHLQDPDLMLALERSLLVQDERRLNTINSPNNKQLERSHHTQSQRALREPRQCSNSHQRSVTSITTIHSTVRPRRYVSVLIDVSTSMEYKCKGQRRIDILMDQLKSFVNCLDAHDSLVIWTFSSKVTRVSSCLVKDLDWIRLHGAVLSLIDGATHMYHCVRRAIMDMQRHSEVFDAHNRPIVRFCLVLTDGYDVNDSSGNPDRGEYEKLMKELHSCKLNNLLLIFVVACKDMRAWKKHIQALTDIHGGTIIRANDMTPTEITQALRSVNTYMTQIIETIKTVSFGRTAIRNPHYSR